LLEKPFPQNQADLQMQLLNSILIRSVDQGRNSTMYRSPVSGAGEFGGYKRDGDL